MEIALKEDIGRPDLFVGRKRELASLLEWVARAEDQLAKSRAILSRRKKGKTALVQRLFNLLYHRNDPAVIPFFFRVKEQPRTIGEFSLLFYCTFVSQVLGYLRREPELINTVLPLGRLEELAGNHPRLTGDIASMREFLQTSPGLAWDHARDAPHRLAALEDKRVIQIIDEFQFLNRYIFKDERFETRLDLCHSYMAAAESKLAPLIVTGSYIGWLDTILTHMTNRFEETRLGGLTDEEALEAVYNYAAVMGVRISEDTAPYISEIAGNDPFYISQIIRTPMPDLDLTTREGARAALQ